MRQHVVVVAILWLVMTAVALFWVTTTQFNPPGYAQEAALIDHAFDFMMLLAAPVFAFVVAMLVYSVLRFRVGAPTEDGPNMGGHAKLTLGWLAMTTGLSVFVIYNPGIIGMMELRHDHPVDMVVQVQGMRFMWRITYPEQKITTNELVLPVNKRVKFEITATDVLHSFWIPAFRVKIDAVPGIVTTTHATPNRLGSFAQDTDLRIQCAELCGVGHGIMRTPVRVVEQQEFDAWVKQQQAARQ